MKKNDCLELRVETIYALTTLAGWATDTSGNEAKISLRIEGYDNDGSTSFTIEQAKTFRDQLTAMIAEVEGAE